jgi:hypothetical protein
VACVAVLALALAKLHCKHAVCAVGMDLLLPLAHILRTRDASKQYLRKAGSQKQKLGNAHACAQAAAHSSNTQRVF